MYMTASALTESNVALLVTRTSTYLIWVPDYPPCTFFLSAACFIMFIRHHRSRVRQKEDDGSEVILAERLSPFLVFRGFLASFL
jgi:hypothetical protein